VNPQALGKALSEGMRRDKNVVLWGIDIDQYGGANGVTKGLYEEFGAERVIELFTPDSYIISG
jgi:pyruvate/2-oxoglutarate/acetoin dehydrogenase E1 component